MPNRGDERKVTKVLRVVSGYRTTGFSVRGPPDRTRPLCAEVLIEFVLHKWPGQDARRTTCAPALLRPAGQRQALCVNCGNNDDIGRSTKRPTNCQHDSATAISLTLCCSVAGCWLMLPLSLLLSVLFAACRDLYRPARNLHILLRCICIVVAALLCHCVSEGQHHSYNMFIAIRHAHCVEIST